MGYVFPDGRGHPEPVPIRWSTCGTSSEWPPSAKNDSSTVLGAAPRGSAQIEAGNRSTEVRGTWAAELVTEPGSGSRRAPTIRANSGRDRPVTR